MKKSIFQRLMTVAMVAIMCVIFTACGGDDGDDITNPPVNPGGSTSTFVEPCLDFGSNQAKVKEYMAGAAWELMSEDGFTLLYGNSDATVGISYNFLNGGLIASVVTFYTENNTTEAKFIASLEKRYSTTMTFNQEDSTTGIHHYSGVATINGRSIEIVVVAYSHMITVLYSRA